MSNRIWKYIALALVGTFWVGCGDDKSSQPTGSVCQYGTSLATYTSDYSTEDVEEVAFQKARNATHDKIDSIMKKSGKSECLKEMLDTIPALVQQQDTTPEISIPKDVICSDGETRLSDEYLQMEKKRARYYEKIDSIYSAQIEVFDKQIENCLQPQALYRLAADTNVTCERDSIEEEKCITKKVGVSICRTNNHFIDIEPEIFCFKDTVIMDSIWESLKKITPSGLRNQLENNQTLSIEELSQLEDKLEDISTYIDYRLGSMKCDSSKITLQYQYRCNNNETYSEDEYREKDFLIYSNEEFSQKFPAESQDSTPETINDSSTTSVTPSPLCQKTDFTTGFEIQNLFSEVAFNKIDSISKALSEDNECLSSIQPVKFWSCDENNFESCNDGFLIARKQICDGDTIVNPRYQAKLDSNEAYINKQIEECLKK